MAEGKKIELPVALDAEKSVIGAILIGGREAMKMMQHIITKDDFSDRRNAVIWRAASYLMKRDKDIDLLTLSDFLRQKLEIDNVGGSAYLAETSNFVPSYYNCHIYAKIVADRAVARRIIIAAQDIMEKATKEDDMDKFVHEAEQRLKGVTKSSARKESKVAVADLEDWRKIARETTPTSGQLRGMSLGYDNLDTLTEGFEPGEVMVITGHTKHGKSKLAANLAWNVAQQGKNVMFINTEMTKLQVGRRMNGMATAGEPTRGKIYLNERADLEAYDAAALMERAKEMGCDMVIIDHLHFFARSEDNQTNVISRITKEFKEAAVQLEIPLILLCHIQQGDSTKRPTLQMLKGSSSIAQDADIVMTVFRDDRPTALEPFKMEVIRLAHRSAERAITHIELYGEGIRLLETRPVTTKQQAQWVADTEKMLGEHHGEDTDSKDLEPGW